MHANIEVSIISSKSGKTSAAVMAYRHAEQLTNPETGQVSDFTARSHIIGGQEMLIPENAPDWAKEIVEKSKADYQAALTDLCAHIDAAEKRADAQLFREFVLTLPYQLPKEQLETLVRDYAQKHLADRGMFVDVAIHLYGSSHSAKEAKPEGVAVILEGQKAPASDHVLLMKNGSWYHYQPHAHILTSLRPMTMDGFGQKRVQIMDRETNQPVLGTNGRPVSVAATDWGKKSTLYSLQGTFHQTIKDHLASVGVEYLTPTERALAPEARLAPEPTLGVAKHLRDKGAEADRAVDWENWRATQHIAAKENPALVIGNLTRNRSTFRDHDIITEISRFAPTAQEVEDLYNAVKRSPELVTLVGEKSEVLYTAADLYDAEYRIVGATVSMSAETAYPIDATRAEPIIQAVQTQLGNPFTADQRASLDAALESGSAVAIEGVAGTGKTTVLTAARAVWEDAGYNVRGLALARQAVANLREAGIAGTSVAAMTRAIDIKEAIDAYNGSGVLPDYLVQMATKRVAEQAQRAPGAAAEFAIISKAVAANQYDETTTPWRDAFIRTLENDIARTLPKAGTIIVVDEAGMIGSRAMERIVTFSHEVGAKMVLVGDREQAPAIEAGAPFRLVAEAIDATRLTTVLRQREPWMREATSMLATRRTAAALALYDKNGHIEVAREFQETNFATGLRRQLPGIADTDINTAITVARYAEARRAAGLEFLANKGSPEFWEWKEMRDAFAGDIGADFKQYAPWIVRFGLDAEAVAEDVIVASGVKRADAQEPTEALLKSWQPILREHVELDPVRLDLRSGARAELIGDWLYGVRSKGSYSDAIMLAHTNADVTDLNLDARTALKADGMLKGDDVVVNFASGPTPITTGDRVVFLARDDAIGVVNGTLATVTDVSTDKLTVQIDKGAEQVVDLAQYNNLQHAYALTIHKRQGATAENAYVLYSGRMGRELTYVAMSRHRDNVRVYGAAAEVPSVKAMMETASVSIGQDSAFDYLKMGDYLPVSNADLDPQARYDIALTRYAQATAMLRLDASRATRTAILEARTELYAAAAGIAPELPDTVAPKPTEQSQYYALNTRLSEAERQAHLEAITSDPVGWAKARLEQTATLSDEDIRHAIFALTRDQEPYKHVRDAIFGHGDFIQLADANGRLRVATLAHYQQEQTTFGHAVVLDSRNNHHVSPNVAAHAYNETERTSGLTFTSDQRAAYRAAIGDSDIVVVEGIAGTGKSSTLTAAKAAWEKSGYRPLGTALSKVAADGLKETAGIRSYTIASLANAQQLNLDLAQVEATGAWSQLLTKTALDTLDRQAQQSKAAGSYAERIRPEIAAGAPKTREAQAWATGFLKDIEKSIAPRLVTPETVLVVDEAGMLDIHQAEFLLHSARANGAKIVLVGDREQAQPIGPGAPFSVLAGILDKADLNTVHRQREQWAKDATVAFATTRTADGLAAYAVRDHIHVGIEANGTALAIRHAMTDAGERQAYTTLVEWLQADRAARLVARTEGFTQEYRNWAARRDQAATVIGNAIEQHRPAIIRAGNIDATKLAETYLRATGLSKTEAEALAPKTVKSWNLDDLAQAPGYGAAPIDLRASAGAALMKDWQSYVSTNPEKTALIITHTNADAASLNRQARDHLATLGRLGETTTLPGLRGEMPVAIGERILFREGSPRLGVSNGTLGTVETIQQNVMVVRLDNGRLAAVDTADYQNFDYGYASTTHRIQGATVDRSFILYTPGMDRQLTYVAFSRHRDDATLYAATADAPTTSTLTALAARNGAKHSAFDFTPVSPPQVAPDSSVDQLVNAYLGLVQERHHAATLGKELGKSHADRESALREQLAEALSAGKAAPGKTSLDTASTLLAAEKTAGAVLRWARVGTAIFRQGFVRGDMIRFTRTVTHAATDAAARATKSSAETPRERAEKAYAGAQTAFNKAAGAYRTTSSNPHVSQAQKDATKDRLDVARKALADAVQKLTEASPLRGIGASEALKTLDPSKPNARQWAKAVTEIAAGLFKGDATAVIRGAFSLMKMSTAEAVTSSQRGQSNDQGRER